VEHIIPESLGNTDHVLPRGAVCDNCNNYFARKIEGPLLETPWFRHARSRQWIPNKRGYTPPMTGIIPAARLLANIWQDDLSLTILGRTEAEHKVLDEAIRTGKATSAYIPIIETIDQRLMSRFLAKVALEILAHRVPEVDGWQDEIVDNLALDRLRGFARVGEVPKSWPFSRRRLYGENDMKLDGGDPYQVLHEFTLLYVPLEVPGHADLFAVVCIFGEEFAINMGEPEIAKYDGWLTAHDRVSPLYQADILPTPFPIQNEGAE
jgi:hypothetical protein